MGTISHPPNHHFYRWYIFTIPKVVYDCFTNINHSYGTWDELRLYLKWRMGKYFSQTGIRLAEFLGSVTIGTRGEITDRRGGSLKHWTVSEGLGLCSMFVSQRISPCFSHNITMIFSYHPILHLVSHSVPIGYHHDPMIFPWFWDHPTFSHRFPMDFTVSAAITRRWRSSATRQCLGVPRFRENGVFGRSRKGRWGWTRSKSVF